jgi:Spy/CpxP family protein refolding chaperone
MKRNLLTLAIAVGIVLSGLAIVQADPGHQGGNCGHGRGAGAFGLERLTESLNLTADQQAKVQPIIDQAKPQIVAIHQDAMQKTHAVMNDAMGKIRPLLTPEQQKKFDDVQTARQEMRDAQQKLHNAIKE